MGDLVLVWSPLLPTLWLGGLALAALAVLALGVPRRAPGLGWRALAAAGLLTALANPSLVAENRERLNDVAVVVVDQSPSQRIGDRAARTERALADLQERLAALPALDVRVVRSGSGEAAGSESGRAPSDGTHLFGALERALADVPRGRFAGAILLTDGQVHDVPEGAPALDGPLHAILTGRRGEADRRLSVVEAPGYTIVGQTARIVLRVDETSGDGARQARVTLRRDGEARGSGLVVPVGSDHAIEVPIDRGGANTFELVAEPGANELTLVNNTAVVVVNGVRDRLRVLLVSGEPHPGERTWRNLLKADPSVDLVHFTILRPPEKQDGTPVRELSLIAFPIRELFEVKLNEFDLIVFDRYQRRGVLPQLYLSNIADYVQKGGALLEAAGAPFAGPQSLWRTPLARVLPAEPTGSVIAEPYRARPTATGRRHPVTAALPGAGRGDAEPDWGRWFRQAEIAPRKGVVTLSGAGERPLLVLDRVGEGRVAQLGSDNIWLWARNFEGGGPHAELLRRLAHWLMKEPELEEDSLGGHGQGDRLVIERRSLEPDPAPVEVTFPSGRTATVALEEQEDGRARGSLVIDEAGLYRLADGTRNAFAAVGTLNPREFADVVATERALAPATEATGGGTVWLADRDYGLPELRRPAHGRTMSGSTGGGRDWLGLQDNGAYAVRGAAEQPLAAAMLLFLLALGAVVMAWWREGR
ncbi:MAG: hypothetical protein AB7N54_08435 [Alphaproteobacteria bacterium]